MILAQADTINVGNDAAEKVYVGDNLVYTQSFLAKFPSASLAFSLRNLTNQDLNVVRVKRAFDFAESDFTATELTDGTLLSFVNTNQTDFMVFDGSSNSIDVNSALLPATGDFTLTINFYIEATGSDRNLFSQGSTGTTGRSVVQIKGNGQAYASISGAGDLTTTDSVISRQFNTIIFSRSGTTLSLKLNDETAVTLTSSQAIEQTDSEIGDCEYTGINFNNVIKSLSVGSTTWDGSESDATSKGWTVNGSAPSSTRFNDGYVAKWYDQSGNGNDASAVNVQIPAGSTARDVVFFDFKIVSSGSYLGHIEVNTSYGLTLDTGSSGQPPLSIFGVYEGGNSIISSNPYGYYLTSAGKAGSKYQLVNPRYLTSTVSNDGNVNVVVFLSRGNDVSSLIFSSQDTTYPGMGFIASGLASFGNQYDPIATIFGDDINGYAGQAHELIVYPINQSTVFSNIAVNQRDYYSI